MLLLSGLLILLKILRKLKWFKWEQLNLFITTTVVLLVSLTYLNCLVGLHALQTILTHKILNANYYLHINWQLCLNTRRCHIHFQYLLHMYIPYGAKFWRGKILMNLMNFYQFVNIFPIKNFTLIIFCHLHARKPFSRRALSLAIVYEPMQYFSLSMQMEHANQWSIAMWTTACIPNSKVTPYIASN